MSQRFELYLAGDSWLHRLDPRTKLALVLAAAVLGLLFKSILVLAGLLLLAHLALFSARVPAGTIGQLWLRLLPLLVMILVLQPLFSSGTGPELLRVGPVRITLDGVLDGASFALRMAALAFSAAVLLVTTESTDLVQGLVRLGLPYPWGLTVDLAIRYLPTTYNLFLTVREAQQARGWIVSRGNLFRRAQAHVPILVATIIAALRLGDNLGLALAARGLGYPARRTTLYALHFGARDWLVVILACVAFLAALILRFGYGLGRAPW